MKRLKGLDNENKFSALAAVLFVYIFSYLGFSYTPYLDDYVQYMLYPSIENPRTSVLFGGIGTAFTRPLAAILDIFFWSRFMSFPWAAVILLLTLYALSGVFFYKALKMTGFGVTPVFLIVYLFSPLCVEGVYWVSASTRICTSLFLASVSAYLAVSKKKGVLIFIGFQLSNLMSLCFYEQTAVLSAALCLVLCVLIKKYKYIAAIILNLLLILCFYLFFGSLGNNSHRLSGLGVDLIAANFGRVFSDFGEILGRLQLELVTNGVKRGLMRIISDRAIGWAAGFITGVFFLYKSSDRLKNGFSLEGCRRLVFFGVLFIILPILPFLILNDPMINLRNAAALNLGIAMAADGMLSAVFKYRAKKAAVVLVVLCALCTVSEVCDYDYTAKSDLYLIQRTADEVKAAPKEKSEITVTSSMPVYFDQNAPFNDHIMSIRGSYWGITGPVKALSGRKDINVIINISE